MSLHPLHPARHARASEIDQVSYHRLMNPLARNAIEHNAYGSSVSGSHPEFGNISLSRLKWPARHRDHAPVAHFVECANEAALAQLTAALERDERS